MKYYGKHSAGPGGAQAGIPGKPPAAHSGLARPPRRGHGFQVRFAVTTVVAPSPAVLEEARAAALRYSVPLLGRVGRSLAGLAAPAGVQVLLVLGRHAALWLDGRERRYDAGMGALRARRLREGERGGRATGDSFLAAALLRPGESVLDCTLGLGADALVAAAAVGAEGRVVGLESSSPLAAWVEAGLRRLDDPAARCVEVRRADHAEALAACPERSYDVVAFDPMFRHPRSQGFGFDLVRKLGDPKPLQPVTLERARRVARRCVLVKDGAPGWDLARLGLEPLPSPRGARRLYARLDPL